MGNESLNVHISVEKFHVIEGQNAHDQINYESQKV